MDVSENLGNMAAAEQGFEQPSSAMLDDMNLGVAIADRFGRVHEDLRLSVTDRCNFACVHCYKLDQEFQPHENILTLKELARVAGVAHDMLGFTSLRLTGGEPTVRAGLLDLVGELSQIGFEDLSMTTNASRLTQLMPKLGGITMAQGLKERGLQRLNISCDSLDEARFRKIRRNGELSVVLGGLKEAQRQGFEPIKMNMVPIRGINDNEIVDFARFARDTYESGSPVIVRFIEFMPLGETGEGQANWTPDKVVTRAEILDTIKDVWPVKPAANQDGNAPATLYGFEDSDAQFGIIPTMSVPFCANCDRGRVTADGYFLRCLFSAEEPQFSIRSLLRQPGGTSDEAIAELITAAIESKKVGQDRDQPDIYTNPGPYQAGPRAANIRAIGGVGG